MVYFKALAASPESLGNGICMVKLLQGKEVF